jgi:phage terminase large subunit GpA-like protein
LIWPNLKWPEDEPFEAYYQCEFNGCRIENWEKTKMLAEGRWTPTNDKHKDKKSVGFHLNALYSPVGWISWGELARDFLEAKKSPELLRSFVNTVLGETWRDRGEAPDWEKVYLKRKDYPMNSLPNGVVFLTCGVDVQQDRLELEIVGWGRNKVSWSIDYRVLHGDTASPDSEVWGRLQDILSEVWETENGAELPIKLMAVDSGYNTQTVYQFCRKFTGGRVVPVKGQDSQTVAISTPKKVDITKKGKTLKSGLKLFSVGVSILKSELYGWLNLPLVKEDEPEPTGYCYFPQYDEEFFRQLTAEELIVTYSKGYRKFTWSKMRERNEALDCRVYARSASIILGIDRYRDVHWDRLEAEVGFVSNKKKEEKPQKETKIEKKPRKKVKITRKKSNFL